MTRCTDRGRRIVQVILAVCLLATVGGCATVAFERPGEFDPAALRKRAQIGLEDDIHVFAAIPSREESIAIFGIDLAEKNVQPVWLEIENTSDQPAYFLRTGLDPEYFSPREVAFAFSESMSDDDRKRLAHHIESLDIDSNIEPRSRASGFVFTNESPGSKFVTLDLLGRGWSSHLTLVVPVPGRSPDRDSVARLETLLSQIDPTSVKDEAQLRSLLENLPCCVLDEKGDQAEPLNVVLIGNLDELIPALLRRRFRRSPLSPRFVFGRPQDGSLKKAEAWIAAQPHELRLWVTNIRFQNRLVWVGQISMPRGGRFAETENDEPLPLIAPDVDEARYDLVQDAIYSQLITDIAFVKGVGAVDPSKPRTTPDGSTYHTDGLRAVLIFHGDPVSLTEIELMNWERIDPGRQ